MLKREKEGKGRKREGELLVQDETEEKEVFKGKMLVQDKTIGDPEGYRRTWPKPEKDVEN